MDPMVEEVRGRLDEIVDPCSAANGTDLSIVEMGLIADIDVVDGDVTVSMRLTSPFCMQRPYFVEEIADRVGDVDWVSSVELETDHGLEWTKEMMSDEASRKCEDRIATAGQGTQPSSS